MILVVDDEPEFLEEVLDTLARRGLSATGESDPARALARLAREPEIDLVLTDLAMPGLDGLSLMTGARHAPGAPQGRRFVVMSGHAGDSGFSAARAAGASAVIRKPVSEEELLRILSIAASHS